MGQGSGCADPVVLTGLGRTGDFRPCRRQRGASSTRGAAQATMGAGLHDTELQDKRALESQGDMGIPQPLNSLDSPASTFLPHKEDALSDGIPGFSLPQGAGTLCPGRWQRLRLFRPFLMGMKEQRALNPARETRRKSNPYPLTWGSR